MLAFLRASSASRRDEAREQQASHVAMLGGSHGATGTLVSIPWPLPDHVGHGIGIMLC